MGMVEAEIQTALDALAAGLRTALDDLSDEYTAGWPSEQLMDIVRIRTRRLDTGDPLGTAEAPRRRPGTRTLDSATIRREAT